MTYYFRKTPTHNNRAFRCTAIILLIISSVLSGCGSKDKLPGGVDASEINSLLQSAPLFYVERSVPTNPDELTDPTAFVGNGRLMKKASVDSAATTTNITSRAFSGNYDVRDMDISSDGKFIVFSMRAPQIEDADDDEQPTWNLWEYDITNDDLYRLISDDILAEKGHDITPRYLPSGDIVFSSTRQQKSRSILLDEGKPAFAALEEDRDRPTLNLHVMESDGTQVRQITFNKSHDFDPLVINNGSIVYTRWDNFSSNNLNLYQTNADGTDNHLIYGHHSHGTDPEYHFTGSNVLSDGQFIVLARPISRSEYGGDFLSIDFDNYTDNFQPTANTNGSGPAQLSITNGTVDLSDEISTAGYYASYSSVWDGTGRILMSWSPCRVIINGKSEPCSSANLANSNATEAPPAYSLWMKTPSTNTQSVLFAASSGHVITEAALAIKRTAPQIYIDGDALTGADDGKVSSITFAELIDAANEEAIIHIRSVYDLDGTPDTNLDGAPNTLSEYAIQSNPSLTDVDELPARFLKIIKGVPEPDDDIKTVANGAFGAAGNQRMKEILGYAPIEPDGSVKVRVPANVPLMLSILDKDGKRISNRHQNWITLRPGEVMECKGCHSPTSELPHGRYDAQATSINSGQPQGSTYNGATSGIASPFANATMAEAKIADDESLLTLSLDLPYSDPWTSTTGPAEFPLSYDDMEHYADLVTAGDTPDNANCTPWASKCRIVINYEQHIQPMWEIARTSIATQHDSGTTTCIRCHSRTNEIAPPGAPIPAGQLELTSELDGGNGIQIRSYVELFNADIALVDDGTGGLTDCTQDVLRVDDNGDPVLDMDDMPIYDTVLCDADVAPTMNGNSALSSSFFDVFDVNVGSHRDYLTPDELRFIAEWLDIGAQYYNNHFDAPDN